MEDTLRESYTKPMPHFLVGLNPCFNGRYSQSASFSCIHHFHTCLNPCFNGRYSQRLQSTIKQMIRQVLILVLMEDTLRVNVVPQENYVRVS